MITQARVHDPDFLAEFSAYYSHQFINVSRFCTRLHFFTKPTGAITDILEYLDSDAPEKLGYLGFITLRPIIKSPVGVSILSEKLASGPVPSADKFPVHLGGVEFSVDGTPFMQQDNAVGACAQASIWMALRTMRKREGNRAYDPAQITDAATKYFVSGRVRPNRQGLTSHQITEAIRAAGYAPHQINLAPMATPMAPEAIATTRMILHAYVESAVPVILLVAPPSGGHAVVIIGQTAVKKTTHFLESKVSLADHSVVSFKHASSWSPAFLIHNDNTGPYRELPDQSPNDYDLTHAKAAIPLLPVDIFMSAEEAFAIGTAMISDIFTALKADGHNPNGLASDLALRLRLVDKRKLRLWGARGKLHANLSAQLRHMDLPKRVWVFELHQTAGFTGQAIKTEATLVGLLLIDPTADILPLSCLLLYMNYQALTQANHGIVMTWHSETGLPSDLFKTADSGPVFPL